MKANLWHKDFTWDGHSFSTQQDIIDFALGHYPELAVFINEWFGASGRIQMKTSGSTGKPKNIELRREHMINSARATATFFELEAGSSALLCLPLGFIAGRMMLVRSMVMGWHLDVIAPTATPEIPKRTHYDFSAMVPLQLYNSISDLENIRTLIAGGGQVSETIIDKISSLNTKIYATYGMTETITHIALSPLNKASGRKGNETIYTALPGVGLSTDHRQCLLINAPHICSKEVVTNDIVDLIAADSFKWLARYDHVINSGGIKLIPELIEARYKHLIDTDFFVYGIPDQRLGEKLVLVIKGSESTSLLEQIKNAHKQWPSSIPKYEIPKEIMFIKNFVMTETGKINRSQTMRL
jgi:O-succinylbenzoic acid--CoA ligase